MNALPAFEITGFTKSGGPLTKRISLGPDGTPKSDGSACVMSRGSATRLRFTSITEFAQSIGNLNPSEAIALGVLRHGLPNDVEIVTKARLEELNGAVAPYIIARIRSGGNSGRCSLRLMQQAHSAMGRRWRPHHGQA
jgi:hypothetical protein